MKPYICYLSLGANLGDRKKTLLKAIDLLARQENISVGKVSSFYKTAPWGKSDQPDFINIAISIITDISPDKLLKVTQKIENMLGRVRHEHWGARTIDIDILYIDGVEIKEKNLTLPHPYMLERGFVMAPLAEIAGEIVYKGHTFNEYLQKITDKLAVKKCLSVVNSPFMKIIVCVDEAGAIGYHNELLASLPEDMKNFKKLTTDNIIVMGANTMRSLPGGKPLPDRINIVLSHRFTSKSGFIFVASVRELVEKITELNKDAQKSVFVIGGGEVYKELMPYCQVAYVTRLKTKFSQADTYFQLADDFYLAENQSESSSIGIDYEFCRYQRMGE